MAITSYGNGNGDGGTLRIDLRPKIQNLQVKKKSTWTPCKVLVNSDSILALAPRIRVLDFRDYCIGSPCTHPSGHWRRLRLTMRMIICVSLDKTTNRAYIVARIGRVICLGYIVTKLGCLDFHSLGIHCTRIHSLGILCSGYCICVGRVKVRGSGAVCGS